MKLMILQNDGNKFFLNSKQSFLPLKPSAQKISCELFLNFEIFQASFCNKKV